MTSLERYYVVGWEPFKVGTCHPSCVPPGLRLVHVTTLYPTRRGGWEHNAIEPDRQ